MQMSQSIGKLAEALSKAQGEMKPAARDRVNTFFRASYSTLEAVISAIKEPFKNNGLAYCQPTHTDPSGSVHVTTVIMHSSGEWISGEATAKPKPSKPDKNGHDQGNAQEVGSLISYLRRYGLLSMSGMSTADDDAESATEHDPEKDKESGNRASVQVQFGNALRAFATFNVTEAMLLAKVKKSRSALTNEDMDVLQTYYQELQREKKA